MSDGDDTDAEHDRVMLDIETLGTDPGAAIVSIGAVRFSTEGLGAELYESVSLASCLDAGLAVEAETFEWWLDQDAAARAALSGGDPLAEVCDRFAAFYDGSEELWAKSPAFDAVLLATAYQAVDREPPWQFWRTRDVRTVQALPESVSLPDDGTAHHALADARKQARNVAGTLREVLDDG